MTKDDRQSNLGKEMRALVTPTRIVTVIIVLLFSLVTYFAGRTWDKTSMDLGEVQSAVHSLKNTKLDTARYEKECEVSRIEIAKKASQEDMKRVDRRLTQILDVLIDPSKKEQIKAEYSADK